MELIRAFLEQTFLQNALWAGLLASISCGLIGPFVIVRHIGYLAGGISHSVLAGMGIAFYLGLSPMIGALMAALGAALLIGWVTLKARQHEDTLISALWSAGMAIGILFISQTAAYNTDLMSYLFGNILMTSQESLYWMAALDAVLLLFVLLFYRPLVAISFDEEFARLRGINVTAFYLLLLSAIALTAVILVQVVGLILVIALLTLPAAISRCFLNSIHHMITMAVALGCFLTLAGTGASYQLDLPTGPMIILLTTLAYLGTVLFKKRT